MVARSSLKDENPGKRRIQPHFSLEYQQFYSYLNQDVDSTRRILPTLQRAVEAIPAVLWHSMPGPVVLVSIPNGL
jgi:hypothetical protein